MDTPNSKLKPWTVLESKKIHQDPWLTLRVDRCRTASGHTIETYDVFEYRDWVNVIAITKDLKVVMVREYRHGSKKIYWGLPSGFLDVTDHSPAEGCRRELFEETGYRGGEFISLGVYSPNPASHTNLCHAFLALDVEATGDRKLDPNEEIEVGLWDIRELFHQVKIGRLDFQAIHMATMLRLIGFVSESADPRLRALLPML